MNELETWANANVMVTLPNIGGALCSTPQSLADAQYYMPCSNLSIVDTCLICEDIARRSCAMVHRWRFLATFLRPVFAASRVQQVSDLHLKFALRPHHVWKYGRHPICGG